MKFDIEKMKKALAECHGGACFSGCYLFDTAIKDEQMRCMNCLNIANEVIKELTEESENWKAIAEGYQKQFEDCAEDRARLTEENEAWQKQLISQKEISDKAYYELACEVENLRAENERLRASSVDYRNFPDIVAEAKADTVRKMQERLKEKLEHYPQRCGDCFKERVDQVAKEMLEET